MATMNINPPKPFNFKDPENWPRWKKRFQQFREVSGLSTGKADDVLTSTNITEEEYERFDDVLTRSDKMLFLNEQSSTREHSWKVKVLNNISPHYITLLKRATTGI